MLCWFVMVACAGAVVVVVVVVVACVVLFQIGSSYHKGDTDENGQWSQGLISAVSCLF